MSANVWLQQQRMQITREKIQTIKCVVRGPLSINFELGKRVTTLNIDLPPAVMIKETIMVHFSSLRGTVESTKN